MVATDRVRRCVTRQHLRAHEIDPKPDAGPDAPFLEAAFDAKLLLRTITCPLR